MTDDEIEQLKKIISSGQKIYWQDINDRFHECIYVDMEWLEQDMDITEPAVRFIDGTYAALYNADFDDFYLEPQKLRDSLKDKNGY